MYRSIIMNRSIFLGFLFAICLSTNSNAFEYDIWNSGISKNEAILIAKRNGRELFEGKMTGGRFFSLMNSKYYRSELMGHPIETHLYFTGKSNFLHTISITWTNALPETTARALQQKIYTVLQNKYGALGFSTSQERNIYNSKNCTGTAEMFFIDNEDTRISLDYKVPCQWLTLRYEDKKLTEMNLMEAKQLQNEKNEDRE